MVCILMTSYDVFCFMFVFSVNLFEDFVDGDFCGFLCRAWPWVSGFVVCVTFSPPWPVAETVTGRRFS